jgi:hypothetical protein
MTETEIVRTLRACLEGLFPPVCPNCRRSFRTFREHCMSTRAIGRTTCHDPELKLWSPLQPLGFVELSLCLCGTMLGLSTTQMPLLQRIDLLRWIQATAEQRYLSPEDALKQIREKLLKQIRQEA